jgi:flagellar biosynthesis protein FlhB
MADNDGDENKTEEPTARRREDARKEGRIAKSQELTAAVLLLAGTGLLASLGGAFSDHLLGLFRNGPAMLQATPPELSGVVRIARNLIVTTMLAMAPYGIGLIIASIAIGLVQTRGLATGKPLEPKWERLNPMAGLKRMFGADAVINLVKATLKLVLLGFITYLMLKRALPRFIELGDAAPPAIVTVLRANVLRLVATVGLAFLGLGVFDFGVQFFRVEKGLKMSRHEVQQEHKEQEGDPQIKARVRQIARQRARQRMLAAVTTADVVITNPTHIAVALKYDTKVAAAPVVVAMGERKMAERIKRLAAGAGVPMIENKPLARALLATCTVGVPIPPALYVAVAEILAFVFRKRRQLPAGLTLEGSRA